MNSSLAVVVLAAGAGTRMKSSLPKVLHPVAGWPMVRHVLEAAQALQPARIVGVVAPGAAAVAAAFAPHPTAVQEAPQGTGHAVRAALPALAGHTGPVLVTYADCPLVQPQTLARLVEACRAQQAAVGVLGFVSAQPGPYGRLIVAGGELQRIVEAKEASAEELAVDFCNSGVMCIDGRRLAEWLGAIRNDNAKGEYYLTDVVALARAAGQKAIALEGPESEFLGVNSRVELAAAEKSLQQRLRLQAMESGVTLVDPETVWLSPDTRIAADVTIFPNVRIGLGVSIDSGCQIKSFCDLEGARIGKDALIGPFARIRPGSQVDDGVHIGNFVELKATHIRAGAKANHLAYVGDSEIGEGSNIGAGTIFVNYDGYGKWRTVVEADAFVGSNSSLIAPVRIGRGANVTAGSVVTEDVPAGAVAFGRARQVTKTERAGPLRAKLKSRAAAAKRPPKS